MWSRHIVSRDSDIPQPEKFTLYDCLLQSVELVRRSIHTYTQLYTLIRRSVRRSFLPPLTGSSTLGDRSIIRILETKRGRLRQQAAESERTDADDLEGAGARERSTPSTTNVRVLKAGEGRDTSE